MTKRVKLNVGGKFYETSQSTLDLIPESAIHTWLKHHQGDEPLFIDRDPQLFRWILQAHRDGGSLPSAKTVGVPDEMWRSELDYYALAVPSLPLSENGAMEEMEETQLSRLESQLKKQRAKYLARKNQQEIEKEKEAEKRKPIYARLIEGGQWQFVWARPGTTGNPIPEAAHSLSFFGQTMVFDSDDWFQRHEQEFKNYAKSLGYIVEIHRGTGDRSTKFGKLPASNYNHSYTKREKNVVTISTFYMNQ